METISLKSAIPFISRKPLEHQQQWLARFKQLLPDEHVLLANDIEEPIRTNCEFAIVLDPEPSILATFNNLKWVQSLWAGVESLIELAKQQQFELVRMIDPKLAETMAEAVLAWSLYLHREMPSFAEQQQNKIWIQRPYRPAAECNIGILGLGELGQASAHKLIQNGFKLSGWSQTQKLIGGIDCYSGPQGLFKITQQSDILICLLPLTPNTKGIINSKLLKHLPANASIINFARGPLLNTDDLLAALDNKKLYHAVLDVFDQEPLPQQSPLWSHSNLTILPHIAATSSPQTAAEIAAQNIQFYRKSGQLPTTVDLQKGY